MDRVSKGDMKSELGPKVQAKKQRTSGGGGATGTLGVARIVTINYEEHTATLRVVLGEDQEFQRVPIPMTYPGAGSRHFLGAMPEEGDYCVIGHLSQETDGRTSTPVILAWIIPGTWIGHDWLMTQPFAPDEYSMDAKDSFFAAGAFQRVRHKLRHMEPGNVLCSSSQGADVVLTEEVLLTNRRGNEIRLRDPDQAVIVRALQEFVSLAGTRTYSGMVQRDATFLPTQMFSDGIPWDGAHQMNVAENRPWTDSELRAFGTGKVSLGDLTPHPVFDRRGDNGLLDEPLSGVFFEANVDPNDFLQRGLFSSSEGVSLDGREQSDAVYGGKSYYRVSPATLADGSYLNAALGGLQGKAYTEHRIEVTHLSDGRLPVTEQTDGFDADRLPRSVPLGTDKVRPQTAPFIEHVMGTVVGNDPYSKAGRPLYGRPLKPLIFDETGPAPAMVPAGPLEEFQQAATLFRMYPPNIVSPEPPTFWGVRKNGTFYGAIGGPQAADFSAEVALRSGLRLSTGGVLRLEVDGLEIATAKGGGSNWGLNLASDKGAVRVYGGGKTTEGSVSSRTAPAGGGESDLPSLVLEGKENVLVKGSRRVLTNSNDVETRATSIVQNALSGIKLEAGDGITVSSKVYNQITAGKATYNFHGPKDNLPTNGAFRSTTFTGIGVGAVDELLVVQGDREEEFLLGNHTTTVQVGNLTYETNAGTWKARAGTNELSLDVATGMSGQISVGNITLEAIAGATTISGQVAITAKSTGPAVLSGAAGVTLGAPGKSGAIVCSSDLDPLTGAPLATYGMGSPGHLLGPSV